MTEMSAELASAFARLQDDHDSFVRKDLHDEVIRGLRDDVRKLEATVNRLLWGIIALGFGIIAQIIVSVSGSPVS